MEFYRKNDHINEGKLKSDNIYLTLTVNSVIAKASLKQVLV